MASFRRRHRASVALVATCLIGCSAWADVKMPAVFGDHMVLQEAPRTLVWGSADEGERVTVSLADRSASAVADATGSWSAALDLEGVAAGPHVLTITGDNRIDISDVLVGDVWFASGQSNMEWTVAESAGGPAEVEASANPAIRHFKVARAFSREPAADVRGEWMVADPATTGRFSAVAYYFAKEVVAETGRPVGILNATWGGTRIEGWLPASTDVAFGGNDGNRTRLWDEHVGFGERQREFADAMEGWATRHGRGDPLEVPPTPPGMPGERWTIELPGPIQAEGLPAVGVVWLWRDVSLPASGGPVILQVPVDGFESVYLDGRLLGSTTASNHPGMGATRRFTIPPGDLEGSDHRIAIRLYQPAASAVFHKPPVIRNLVETVTLDGPWSAWVEREFAPPTPEMLADLPEVPAQPVAGHWLPSGLYHAMVAPLHRFGVRGILWYQGESNSGRSSRPYGAMFRKLITSWRDGWGQGDLPFFFCQLAAFKAKTDDPGAESGWAGVREAQTSVLDLPATGQAVLLDVGEAGDVHPRDKATPGHRLARLALAEVYGHDVVASGPVPVALRLVEGRVVVDFEGGGLVARPLGPDHVISSATGHRAPLEPMAPGSEVQGFALRGADGRWHWANAMVEGGSVVVWADEVPSPVEIRYAWADNPTANLFNDAGLPAGPFRGVPLE